MFRLIHYPTHRDANIKYKHNPYHGQFIGIHSHSHITSSKLPPASPKNVDFALTTQVADAIADDIVHYLPPPSGDGQTTTPPIKLTGHSLGGAVAVIVAAKLKIRGYRVDKVMTFGAPKATDARGAERLRELLSVLRVTHERDPVPLMPLARAKWKAASTGQKQEQKQEEVAGFVAKEAVFRRELGEKNDDEDYDAGRGLCSVGEAEGDGGLGVGVGKGVLVGGGGNGGGGGGIGSSASYSHFGSQVRICPRRTLDTMIL